MFGMEEDIRQLKEDIDLRNAQIADLQQKILDSDQENKVKTRWDTIQSMADANRDLHHQLQLATFVTVTTGANTRNNLLRIPILPYTAIYFLCSTNCSSALDHLYDLYQSHNST
jgi:hypothetical protein